MSRSTPPPMPSTVRSELKQAFEQLPPSHVRWSTLAGQRFLMQLAQAHGDYGTRQCAQAIGLKRVAAIYEMLDRQVTRKAAGWPSDTELSDARQAWAALDILREQGRYARRDRPEYERMHEALVALMATYPPKVISAAMNIKLTTLRRYLDPPLPNKEERRDLALLIYLYEILARSRPNNDVAEKFHAALKKACQQMSTAKIAAALKLTPATVEQLADQRRAG